MSSTQRLNYCLEKLIRKITKKQIKVENLYTKIKELYMYINEEDILKTKLKTFSNLHLKKNFEKFNQQR